MNQEEVRLRVIEIHEDYNFQCQRCNSRSTEIAHRISKSKSNRSMIKDRLRHLNLDGKISVDSVIHHDFNVVASCNKCNDYFNIGFKPMEVTRLLNRIFEDLQK